jgi:glutamyl-tRNA synthetase
LADGTVLYNGRCRTLTPQQAAQYAGQRHALRIAVPNETITFCDGKMGTVAQNLAQECGDFIVRRSDGTYAYQLAVVVDDARMGITEVVRGQDLLGSTPRQIWLLRLLGAPIPRYIHVPLLCAPDGRRLSKREQDLDMGALRARYTAPQLLGKLAALAGLVPTPQPLTAQQLVPLFTWDAVPQQSICIASDWF